MRKLIFDTETTGLNPYGNQIAQLSYLMIDDNYEVKTAKNFYFAVDCVEAGASEVNGLTKKVLDELSEGKKFKDFSNEIYEDFLNAETLIAHNLEFDLNFIRQEFKRLDYNVDALDENKEYLCTMNIYTDILKIEHKYYGYKYPRLDEVMSRLDISRKYISNIANDIFRIEDIGYHDARFDIVATLLAYKSLENIEKIHDLL
ncbi:MAG: 3'-5' exonuclease [Terrisporobacter sp.]